LHLLTFMSAKLQLAPGQTSTSSKGVDYDTRAP
jgi:hypothetical protein